MKKAITILLLICTAIVLITYYKLWSTTVIVLYLLIALVSAIFELTGILKMLKIDFSKTDADFSAVSQIALNWNFKTSLWNKFRQKILLILSVTNIGLCWPVFLLWGMLRSKSIGTNVVATMAHIQLNTKEFYCSVYYFIMSLFLFSLYWSGLSDNSLITSFTVIFIVSIFIQLLTFLLSDDDLASIFKSSPGNILKRVLVFCLLITISLFTFFVIISAYRNSGQIDKTAIQNVFYELFKQESVGLLWRGEFSKVEMFNFTMNISGWLFLATIADTLKNYKRFKREKKHINRIVKAYLNRQDYNKAIKWLGKIPSSDWDDETFQFYTIALAGLQQIDKAITTFFNTKDGTTIQTSDYNKDITYQQLIVILISYKIDFKTTNAILSKWASICECDGILFLTLIFLSTYEEVDIEKLYGVLLERPESKDLFVTRSYLSESSLNEFVESLENKLVEGGLDNVTKCTVNFFLMTHYYDDNLERFEKSLMEFHKIGESVIKAKDLYFVLSNFIGLLGMTKTDKKNYEKLLYIYNDLKNNFSSDYQTLIDQLNYAINKQDNTVE